jgi:hypothetical protein
MVNLTRAYLQAEKCSPDLATLRTASRRSRQDLGRFRLGNTVRVVLAMERMSLCE